MPFFWLFIKHPFQKNLFLDRVFFYFGFLFSKKKRFLLCNSIFFSFFFPRFLTFVAKINPAQTIDHSNKRFLKAKKISFFLFFEFRYFIFIYFLFFICFNFFQFFSIILKQNLSFSFQKNIFSN